MFQFAELICIINGLLPSMRVFVSSMEYVWMLCGRGSIFSASACGVECVTIIRLLFEIVLLSTVLFKDY